MKRTSLSWKLMLAVIFLCAGWVAPAVAQTITLSVPPVTVAEGDATATVDVDIFLDQISATDVTFEYFTADGTAREGVDYAGIPLTAGVIPAGTQQIAIPMTILGNTLAEGDKTFALQLINISGAAPATTFGVITLINDDTPLGLAPPAGALPVGRYATAYSETFTASGGTGSFSYSASGTLPAGLTLSSIGVLSGTPTAAGQVNFSVTAIDTGSVGPGAPYSVTEAYTLRIDPAAITLAPTTLAPQPAGASSSAVVAADGGIGPYSYALSSGTLPPGIVLDAGGALMGTPAAVGRYVFTVLAIDANAQTGSQSYTWDITPPTLVNSPADGAFPDAAYNVAYSQTITTSGGTGPYTYAVSSGAVPPGLSLGSAGTLSGTPTAPGLFTFRVDATDQGTSGAGAPFTATSLYTVTVGVSPITVAPGALPNLVVASPYSQTLSASGGVPSYTYAVTAGALPAGVSLSPSGSISGTPTQAGTFSFSIAATDANGQTGSQAYSVVVAAPSLAISPASGALTAAYGTAFSQRLATTGGVGPYSYAVTAGALPAGISLSGDQLAGTPTTPGTYTFTVTSTDAGSSGTGSPFSASAAYTLTVTSPSIVLDPASAPAATVAVAYAQSFTASGGTGSYQFSLAAGSLPQGLTLAADGTLSGTPTQAGTFSFSIAATDANGQTGSQAYSLVVAAPSLAISPAPGALTAVYGTAFSERLATTGGVGPYSYAVTAGALPAGISLSGDQLAGTPTTPGTYTFTVTSTDAGSSGTGSPFSASAAYTLTVTSPSIVLDPASAPAATVAVAYAQSFTASGGTGSYQFSLAAGSLPQGLTLAADGTLSGTPTQAGTFSISIAATDANGQTGSQAYSLVVTPPVLTTPPSAGALTAAYGTAFSQRLATTGGVGPYSYAVTAGALPAGISLSGDQLAGTPTTPGTYTFTVTSTDAGSSGTGSPFSVSANYTLQVAAPSISISTPALPDGTVGLSYDLQLVADGGAAPYSFAVTSGTLPAGLQLSASGQLNGTPTASGTSSVTVTATDANGQPGTRAYTLQVGEAAPVGQADAATATGTTPLPIGVTDNDSGAITSIAVVQQPQHGAVSVAGLIVTYTAQAGFSGVDSFQYTASGPGGTTNPIQVTVTVNPVPVAISRSVTAAATAETRVDLTEGASGGPFISATLLSLTPADSGTAAIVAVAGGGQELRFRASTSFSGEAVVSFTLSNAYATSAPASVRLRVQPRPDPTLDPDVRGLANAQLESARRFAHTQIDNFQSRLERLHGQASRSQRLDNQLSFAVRQRCMRANGPGASSHCADGPLPPAMDGDDAMGAHGNAAPASVPGRDQEALHAGGWISGTLRSGGYRGLASTSNVGFETSGVSAGYDADVSQDLSLGAGLGYGRDSSDVGQLGSRSKAEAFSAVGYASYHPGAFFIDGLLGYQVLRYDLRRHLTAADGFVDADRDGAQWFASVSVGADLQAGSAQVTPYVRYDVARGDLDPYREHGSELWGLAYGRSNVASTRGSAGVRFDFRREFDWGAVTPLLRVEYQRELEGNDRSTVRYADVQTGPFYDLRPANYDRSRFVLGVGATFSWSSGWRTRVEYRADAASRDQHENAYLLNLEKEF